MDRFLDEMENPLIECQASVIASQESLSSAISYNGISPTSFKTHLKSIGSGVTVSECQNHELSAPGDAMKQSLVSASNKYAGSQKVSEGGLLSAFSLIDESGRDSVQITSFANFVPKDPISMPENNCHVLGVVGLNSGTLTMQSAIMPSANIESQPIDSIAVVESALVLETALEPVNAESEKRISIMPSKPCHNSVLADLQPACSIDPFICISIKPFNSLAVDPAFNELKSSASVAISDMVGVSSGAEVENSKVDSENVNCSFVQDPVIVTPSAHVNSSGLPEFTGLSVNLTDIPVKNLVLPVDLMDDMKVSTETTVHLVDHQHQMVDKNAEPAAGDVKKVQETSPLVEISFPMTVPFTLDDSFDDPMSCVSANTDSVQMIGCESVSDVTRESIFKVPRVVLMPFNPEQNSLQISLSSCNPFHLVKTLVCETDPHYSKTANQSDAGSPTGLKPFPSIYSSEVTESNRLGKSTESSGFTNEDLSSVVTNSFRPTADFLRLPSKATLGNDLCTASAFNAIDNSGKQGNEATPSVSGGYPIFPVTFLDLNNKLDVPGPGTTHVISDKDDVVAVTDTGAYQDTNQDCSKLGSVGDSRKVSSFADCHVGSSLVSS